jgi:hydrocephalus-inducing protein
VDVEFFPDQPKHYKALVPFSVNGLYTVNVVYTGEASPMRLELVKPEQNSVHFGHVREGHKETREIRMVNKSKLPVTCVVDKQCLEDLAALGVTPADGWNGQTPVMFPPRQANGMSFTYKPSRRGPSFDEELKLLINGATMPISLTRLRGGSIGTEVRLATDTMSFGTVTLGSRVSKKLAMQNTGDVGVKFAFDAKAAGPEFSIKPSEGFVPANQDVQLEVWFHPTTQGADIRADKIKCQIGGKGAGSAEPLDLTLTGACVPQEAQEGVVEFKTTARLTTEGSVSVTNSGTQTWNLKPTVTGDQWSGPEFFEVKPGATAEYTLTYKPLSMSTEEEPHTGSVLFALPDGSCLLHSLKGVADEPDSMGAVEAEVPARQPGSVRVKVANWLNKRQRFKVSVEIEGADPEKPDPTVSLKGPDYFDCPASAEREYKLGFFAHKEGQTKAKVTFTNEDTKEFAHYDVTVTATAADVQGTLRLHGAVQAKGVGQGEGCQPAARARGVHRKVRSRVRDRAGDPGGSRQRQRAVRDFVQADDRGAGDGATLRVVQRRARKHNAPREALVGAGAARTRRLLRRPAGTKRDQGVQVYPLRRTGVADGVHVRVPERRHRRPVRVRSDARGSRRRRRRHGTKFGDRIRADENRLALQGRARGQVRVRARVRLPSHRQVRAAQAARSFQAQRQRRLCSFQERV